MRALNVLGAIRNNRRGVADRPRFLTYIVTFTCNARCIMCDSWKKPSKDALETWEVERIFRQMPELDVIRLSGGEPFVRPDLLDICHLAQEHLEPLFVHVTTNGFLTERIVDFCEKRDKCVPLQMLVSVDGVGEKHNEVRGQSHAWDAVMQTLTALAPRQKALRIRLAVNQTIVDAEGAEHYRRLREMLRPLGVRNNIVIAYDASATYSLTRGMVADGQIGRFTTFGDFSSAQIAALLDDVEADLSELPFPERIGKRYYLEGVRRRLLHGESTPNPPCVALSSHMRLMPNGDVPVCQFNTRTVGNLRRQSFDEVWYGRDIEPERSWVRACPGCWAECEVLPSAIYTGDLARPRALSGFGRPDRKRERSDPDRGLE